MGSWLILFHLEDGGYRGLFLLLGQDAVVDVVKTGIGEGVEVLGPIKLFVVLARVHTQLCSLHDVCHVSGCWPLLTAWRPKSLIMLDSIVVVVLRDDVA